MWWHTFLGSWNGTAMMRSQVQWTPAVQLYTDAAGEVGCGAWCGAHWLQLKWATAAWRGIPITQKEVLPAVLACTVWGHQWKARRVQLYCDHVAAVGCPECRLFLSSTHHAPSKVIILCEGLL